MYQFFSFLLDYWPEVSEVFLTMGRGRKTKIQKMKNRKRQTAKKVREKKFSESIHRSRLA